MTNRDPHSRRRSTTTSRTGSSTGGAGQVAAQIGADGVEPAISLGGGLTVDASGDLGLRVAPGVSVDLTPDTTTY